MEENNILKSQESKESQENKENNQSSSYLTEEHIEFFINNGYVVIPNVFTNNEIELFRNSLHLTMSKLGFYHQQMSKEELQNIPRFGPQSQIFYPNWKLKIQEDPRFFNIMSELWKHTFASNKEGFQTYFSGFDYTKGYFYIDRVNYRLPDYIAPQGGLGLHVDCDPRDPLSDPDKWRPIQASIVLTDCLNSTSGGLCVVPGMHTKIQEYVNRKISLQGNQKKNSTPSTIKCGAFTRLHQCHDLVSRIEPVFATAGSIVLWDNRLPHGTVEQNTTFDTREVLFMTYLPYIPRNTQYAFNQLVHYQQGILPPDFIKNAKKGCIDQQKECTGEHHYKFSELGRKLMGIDSWEEEQEEQEEQKKVQQEEVKEEVNDEIQNEELKIESKVESKRSKRKSKDK